MIIYTDLTGLTGETNTLVSIWRFSLFLGARSYREECNQGQRPVEVLLERKKILIKKTYTKQYRRFDRESEKS